jgi:flagellar basal body-associated protein FliL
MDFGLTHSSTNAEHQQHPQHAPLSFSASRLSVFNPSVISTSNDNGQQTRHLRLNIQDPDDSFLTRILNTTASIATLASANNSNNANNANASTPPNTNTNTTTLPPISSMTNRVSNEQDNYPSSPFDNDAGNDSVGNTGMGMGSMGSMGMGNSEFIRQEVAQLLLPPDQEQTNANTNTKQKPTLFSSIANYASVKNLVSLVFLILIVVLSIYILYCIYNIMCKLNWFGSETTAEETSTEEQNKEQMAVAGSAITTTTTLNSTNGTNQSISLFDYINMNDASNMPEIIKERHQINEKISNQSADQMPADAVVVGGVNTTSPLKTLQSRLSEESLRERLNEIVTKASEREFEPSGMLSSMQSGFSTGFGLSSLFQRNDSTAQDSGSESGALNVILSLDMTNGDNGDDEQDDGDNGDNDDNNDKVSVLSSETSASEQSSAKSAEKPIEQPKRAGGRKKNTNNKTTTSSAVKVKRTQRKQTANLASVEEESNGAVDGTVDGAVDGTVDGAVDTTTVSAPLDKSNERQISTSASAMAKNIYKQKI